MIPAGEARILEAIDALAGVDPELEISQILKDIVSGAAEAWMTADEEGCAILEPRVSCLWVYGLHSRRGTLGQTCQIVRARAHQLGLSKIRGWSVRQGWERLLGARRLPGAVYEAEV